jgi:hypothetical protein
MYDFTTLSETTLVGMAGILVLGGWVVLAFFRSHHAFKTRERLYHSLCDRIQQGDVVAPSEYERLSHDDRAALEAMQLTKKTMAAGRQDVAVFHATSIVLTEGNAPVRHRG